LLALLFALWFAIAPSQFGGQAAFVIVNGTSMEPLYHGGDLVIVHASADYQVGDIVTYRHPQIGPVIHRIIGRDGDRWIFQGDNNDFVDSYRPLQSELIGRSWLHLPYAGRALAWLRTPLVFTLLILATGGICVSQVLKAKTPHTRGAKRLGNLATQRQPARWPGALVGTFGVLALASLVLAWFAFTRPLLRDVPQELSYQHSGEFHYSAAAPPGLYDAPEVRNGEPIFRQLAQALNVEFAYTVQADSTADVRGSGRLIAQLSTLNGWKRTIELQPKQSFQGQSLALRGELDLVAIQALIDNLERQTGIKRQQYILAFVPEVSVEGTLDGQPLHDTFAPRLEFQVDELQLQLLRDGAGEQDVLRPSKAGLLKRTRSEPNTLAVFGQEWMLSDARLIALIGLALALLGMCAAGVPLVRAMWHDEAARIRLKYGPLIVDSSGGAQATGERIVELATIDDLAKLAEKHGVMILHQANGVTHRYLVHDAAGAYVYEASTSAGYIEAQSPKQASLPATGLRMSIPAYDRQRTRIPAESLDIPAAPREHWQADFLAALREYGCVPEACRAVGISVASAYLAREREPSFAQAWSKVRAGARRQRPYGVKSV
jgi:signal peptidase I